METKNFSRRDFLRASALTAAGLALSGCGQPIATPTEAQATAAPTQAPPTAEPVSLTIWEWENSRKPFYEAMTQAYSEKMNNAVTFDIQWVPIDEFWTKIQAAIPSGTGPDIFRVHNMHLAEFINNKFIEPLPADLFPRATLEEEFADVKDGVFDYKDGNIYMLSDGTVGPVIGVNQTMWEEAGLTDADIPETWDQLIEVAKAMTKTDASGEITQPGLTMIGQLWDFFRSMLYQHGVFQFTEDIKKVQFNTPTGRAVLELIDSFYTEHKIASRTDLEATESFGTGKGAMIWAWTWLNGLMKSTYPDTKFFTFPVPGLTTNVPAYGLKSWELSFTTNATVSAERKKAAWDFIHWYFLSDEHTFLLDAAEVIAALPQKIKLQNHPRVTADPMTQSMANRVDRLVYMGDEVGPVTWSVWAWVDQSFVQDNEDIDTVLEAIQSEGDQILAETDFWVVERNYKYANEFKG